MLCSLWAPLALEFAAVLITCGVALSLGMQHWESLRAFPPSARGQATEVTAGHHTPRWHERYKWRNFKGKKPAACSREGLTSTFLECLRTLQFSEKFIRKNEKKSWAVLILGGGLMANFEKMQFLINTAELII